MDINNARTNPIISKFKIFTSKNAELAWLNDMGRKGYLLVSINDSKFKFEQHEGEVYYYTCENIGISPKCEKGEAIISQYAAEGKKALLCSGNKVYFMSYSPVRVSKRTILTEYVSSLTREAYYSMLSVVLFAITFYQIKSISFLDSVGYTSEELSQKTVGNSSTLFGMITNAWRTVLNQVIKFINFYFSLWTDIFGNSDAVKVMSVVLPLAIIFAVAGISGFGTAVRKFNEYRSYDDTETNQDEEVIPYGE